MSKMKEIYTCSKCGAQSLKWNGRCFECGGWGTLSKQIIDEKRDLSKNMSEIQVAELIDLNNLDQKDFKRIESGISEVDRVFGGGVVPGSLILISGEPGIGKSTLLAQITDAIGRKLDNGVIYVSGEESAVQVKDRLERLKCDLSKIKFLSEINTEKIIATAKKEKPKLLIVDSVQTVYSSEVSAETGSVSQIRASTVKFLEMAKNNNIATFLVGHITKDGQVAGPKTLEHIVDTVLYLESEKNSDYRILRATKNRFGSVDEIGIFEMTGSGFKEVPNPSSVFIEKNNQNATGSVISCVMEGSRPFLIEIQALVSKTVFGYPQRKASGFDLNRLQVLCAVLTKRTKVNLVNQDVILNIVGGMRVNDPGLDLAVCLAIASSFYNLTISEKTMIVGEVGLGGETRKVNKLKERINEVDKLGFNKVVIPNVDIKSNIKIEKIKTLDQAVNFFGCFKKIIKMKKDYE